MNPYSHLSNAQLERESQRATRELQRREKEAERDARLRRAEAIIADLQTGLPAGQVKLSRRVDGVARTANEAAEIARLALGGRIRVGRELETESKERKTDRDLIQQRVTRLEMQEIDRNRQNRR